MQWLMITGSLACGMAFHNCAARYMYALGREGVLPSLKHTVGRTHPGTAPRTSRASSRRS